MRETSTIANDRQVELLREAISLQAPLMLSCRLDCGWVRFKSFFLGFDRSSGDLVVAYPSSPECFDPDILEGQLVGASFRRTYRNCVFETSVLGRCLYSAGQSEEIPGLRLLWPSEITEFQRRVYYRTPVPADMYLPVQVRLRDPFMGDEETVRPYLGQLVNLSAGGLSLRLKHDNPRWRSGAALSCSFVATPGRPPLQSDAILRYLEELPEGGVRMGMQFVGLETTGDTRSTLEEIVELTRMLQQTYIQQGAAPSSCQ